LLTRNPAFY
jgi:hypothetical protein